MCSARRPTLSSLLGYPPDGALRVLCVYFESGLFVLSPFSCVPPSLPLFRFLVFGWIVLLFATVPSTLRPTPFKHQRQPAIHHLHETRYTPPIPTTLRCTLHQNHQQQQQMRSSPPTTTTGDDCFAGGSCRPCWTAPGRRGPSIGSARSRWSAWTSWPGTPPHG